MEDVDSLDIGRYEEDDWIREELCAPDQLLLAYQAFVDRYSELSKTLPGCWIAFDKKEIVGQELDYPSLLKKINKKYTDLSLIFITSVSDDFYHEATKLLSGKHTSA